MPGAARGSHRRTGVVARHRGGPVRVGHQGDRREGHRRHRLKDICTVKLPFNHAVIVVLHKNDIEMTSSLVNPLQITIQARRVRQFFFVF